MNNHSDSAHDKASFVVWLIELLKKLRLWAAFTTLLVTVTIPFLVRSLSWPEKLLVFGLAGSFAIILQILHSIEINLRPRITTKRYRSLINAVNHISDIIHKDRRPDINIEILASDGGFIIYLIRELEKAAKGANKKLGITIRLVSENSPLIDRMPGHWKEDVNRNLGVLKVLEAENANLTLVQVRYDYIPCVAGLLINSEHLFLGFYTWRKKKESFKFDAAQEPHIYYSRKDSEFEIYFRLFESWSKLAPQTGEAPRTVM